MTQMEARYVSE